MTRVYRSLGDGLRADVGRAIAMATGGVLLFAPIEYVLTVAGYSGETSLASKVNLVMLAATLSMILWLLLVVALVQIVVIARLVRTRIDPDAATGHGLFEAAPLLPEDNIRRGVPRLWAGVVAALLLGLAIQRLTVWATGKYKEPQLTAGVIAAFSVGMVLLAVPLHRGMTLAANIGARAIRPLGMFNALGRWRAAGIAMGALVAGGLGASWLLLPQSRSVIPVRAALSIVVLAIGMGLGSRFYSLHARRPHPRRTLKRKRALAVAGGALVINVSTLLYFGADLETKYTAVTASPMFDKLIDLVRVANDLDRDGFGTLLGEADCAPLDPDIHPGARDIPDDGIDQNCDGRDTTMADLVAPTGPVVPVPEKFRRSDWNVLLITIDTVRYDHTSFGGYKNTRDTTPRLSEMVDRSTSFTYAQAPSAGTMASVPAILTSKFFHSGIAIDDRPRPGGMPPKILPENVTFPEIMKRGGYHTGAIGSHEWWTDWGIEQGFDEFDNSIGKVPDPYRVVADKVTDHTIAWISRNQNRKWFLWSHYIDPHGRYVAHPDVVDYGTSEGDLYDAEIRWTDQEVGRLFDELRRLPSWNKTIVIITSDHGESMGEHGIPLGTHGTGLYRELTHVPLIFFIPDNPPRKLDGAVSILDILPTTAALAGIDTSKDRFEGKSLVGPLFYGTEDKDRIVFSETNAPIKRRAAISSRYRLIYTLQNNLYELFDREADPLERVNVAGKEVGAVDVMKTALTNWMDRVMYDRDPKFNQAFRVTIGDVIMKEPPKPVVEVSKQSFDGKIQIIGIGHSEKPRAKGKVDFYVYFKIDEPITTAYKLQLVGWPVGPDAKPTDAITAGAIRSPLRLTAEGAYATNKWQKGEYIRERFTLTLPASWSGDAIMLGLMAQHVSTPTKYKPTGPTPSNDDSLAVLGSLPVEK